MQSKMYMWGVIAKQTDQKLRTTSVSICVICYLWLDEWRNVWTIYFFQLFFYDDIYLPHIYFASYFRYNFNNIFKTSINLTSMHLDKFLLRF